MQFSSSDEGVAKSVPLALSCAFGVALPAGRGSGISGQLEFAEGTSGHEDQARRPLAGSLATTAQTYF